MTRSGRSWPWWRWILTGLNLLALVLSIYLGWHSLVDSSMIGCGSGSSCDQVLSSRWSTIGGVLPVSALAAGAYFAMLVAGFFIGPTTPESVRRLAWSAILVIVGCAAGSAVWFTILQKWVIGAFCPYCMTAHVTGLLLAALVLWHARSVFHPRFSVPIGLTLIGLVFAGVLAVCQVVITPPPVYIAGQSEERAPDIDTHAVPTIGAPDANYVVTVLFDYTCPHCQRMHFMLPEVVRRYDGKLAFTLCPAPLDRECNPYITRDVEVFKDSCELSKIGLAVWLADREVFPAFEDWMFSFGARAASTRPKPKRSNWSVRQSSTPPGPIPGSRRIWKPLLGFTARPSRTAKAPFPN